MKKLLTVNTLPENDPAALTTLEILRSVAAPPPGSATCFHFVRDEFAKNY